MNLPGELSMRSETVTILSDDQVTATVTVCSVLGHEVRLRLVQRLFGNASGCTVAELQQAASGIDEVTVRHHLQKLVAAGLVAEERQGRQKFYTLNSREASALIYQLSLLLWYPPVKAEETA